ncbi:MAG: hypothetical protein E5X72_19165 [Mesorhizobium sp.]|uniref:MAE_28990/MAE_18760 family HEPN-like nuclease n=1 Tax=Mesorhizobium sp. TaxID=1871066 RepID=UPI0011F6DF61|nr:MAE_28990/MAE_18760 family HEPN-like nuclease [Mesorhizobium sp.]TIP02798.1 MAG: hypothetical protein E5X72_19165 [Mesorhizobium sp.]
MSKPYTEQNLSDLFDEDLIWRRRELSDMKAVVRAADAAAKSVMLRAMIRMSYAHWEGYVRFCANRYFEYLAIRKQPYSAFERQVYVNSFLVRLDALYRSRSNIESLCKIVNDIIDGTDGLFRYVNPLLIDTKSNLNTDVMKEICLICAVDQTYFESKRVFLDQFVLKRRNAIAHGQQEFIHESEVDDLVSEILALMQQFRTLLENKVYLKEYAA